uniref:Uncharacterized protein n=1 Tax=Oryza nivara TaxID=4536 RepID=A0A0E0J2P6_ORYNI
MQKAAVAVGASSPASSGEHHKPTVEEGGTVSASRRVVTCSRSRRWRKADPCQRVLLLSTSGRCGRTEEWFCATVHCMATGDRSEVMNRSLQRYDIHFQK